MLSLYGKRAGFFLHSKPITTCYNCVMIMVSKYDIFVSLQASATILKNKFHEKYDR